jgi:SAM-dependent methyltransferase
VGKRSAESSALLRLFAPDLAEQEAEAQAELDRAAHDRMRIHEADLTPPDMAGQACWALARYLSLQPARILDPTAGAGCFPMAARAQWPGAHITGCEAREEEERHLEAWCDVHHMGDFFYFAEDGEDDKRFDLVLTNPPFTLIPELLRACLGLVRPGGLVAFLCRMTFGDKKEADQLFRPPFELTHALEFAGRWRFRVGKNPKTGKPYGVDSVGYRLLVWRRPIGVERAAGTIIMRKLDQLPADSRRWRKTASGLWVKPGSEYLHGPGSADPLEALPAVPWRPAA